MSAPSLWADGRAWLQTIAIIVALILFVAREFLEARRRKDARARKLTAIKAILGRACELNHWSIKTLRRTLMALKPSEKVPAMELKIEFRRNGRAVLSSENPDGSWSEHHLPEAHERDFQRQLLDVTELDPTLWPLLENALTGLAEFTHIRDSLISYALKEDAFFDTHRFFDGFVDYGLDEIDEAFRALDTLYRVCVGQPLTEHRLR